MEINPYQAGYEVPDEETFGPERLYGGIGRAGYFLGYIAISFGESFLSMAAFSVTEPLDQGAETLIMLITGVATIAISWYRMTNQGCSGWWGVASIIPLINVFVFIRCVVYPEGYADHRTMDTAGKIIGGLLALFLVLIVAMVVLIPWA